MKTILSFFALGLFTLSACSSSKYTSSEHDDRYFSNADMQKERRQLKKLSDDNEQVQKQAAPLENYKQYRDTSSASAQVQGNTTVNNNYYYDMDDYYDYMYASRIRRFYNPYPASSYYSPYYTNMYWYNYDPFFFGTSIYTSYSFFNPYVPWGYNTWTPGWNFGWNSWSGFYMNYSWRPWGWTPYYSPFYYNPWAFNPYGYNYGFMHGYNMALMQQKYSNNQMYYNSYDQNTYNPPPVNKPNTGGFGAGSNMMKTSQTLGQTLSKEIGTNNISGKNIPNTSNKNLNTGTSAITAPTNSGGNSSKPSLSNGQDNLGQKVLEKDVRSTQPQNNNGLNQMNNAGTKGVSNQKDKEGLILNRQPQSGNNNLYNSVPSTNTPVSKDNQINRPEINNKTDVDLKQNTQPYKPLYDYNNTLPAQNPNRSDVRQQQPVNSDFQQRQNNLNQPPVQNDIQNRNYQQKPDFRQNDYNRPTPVNPPLNQAPSRGNDIRQNNQQPVSRPGSQDMNRNIRMQAPERQSERYSAPARSFDRAPGNNNIGGGNNQRKFQGGGSQGGRTIERSSGIRR